MNIIFNVQAWYKIKYSDISSNVIKFSDIWVYFLCLTYSRLTYSLLLNNMSFVTTFIFLTISKISVWNVLSLFLIFWQIWGWTFWNKVRIKRNARNTTNFNNVTTHKTLYSFQFTHPKLSVISFRFLILWWGTSQRSFNWLVSSGRRN